jgi:hypothetical protein
MTKWETILQIIKILIGLAILIEGYIFLTHIKI